MKNLILIIVIGLLILSCEDNIVESNNDLFDDSNVSDSVKNLYQLDAHRLALRDMKQNDEQYLYKVEISEELFQKYYRGLISILNSSYTLEVDSIKNIYEIHTFPEPRFNSIFISVEKDSIFYDRVISNQLTGINSYDSLVEKYKFELTRAWKSTNVNLLVYWTDDINNLDAICNKFEKISIVQIASPSSYFGDGNEIIAESFNDRIEYEFQRKWGDCESGCAEKHIWKFAYYYDVSVELLGIFGDKLNH